MPELRPQIESIHVCNLTHSLVYKGSQEATRTSLRASLGVWFMISRVLVNKSKDEIISQGNVWVTKMKGEK